METHYEKPLQIAPAPRVRTEKLGRRASDVLSALKMPVCLSLVGCMLATTGCRKSLSEKIASNPKVTVEDVLSNPQQWVNRDVIIEGAVTFLSQSGVDVDRSGKYGFRVCGRDAYVLVQSNAYAASKVTLVNNWKSPKFKTAPLSQLQNFVLENRLQDSTYLVSGVVRRFPDTQALYIELGGVVQR